MCNNCRADSILLPTGGQAERSGFDSHCQFGILGGPAFTLESSAFVVVASCAGNIEVFETSVTSEVTTPVGCVEEVLHLCPGYPPVMPAMTSMAV